MNTKHVAAGILVATGLFLGVSNRAFAAPSIAQTWVSGVVYDASHTPVSGGSVTVHCGPGSQVVSIAGDGTYTAIFDQTVCHAGDTASGTAATSDGTGSNSTTVQNTSVNGPIVDLDIAVIDISVPEFGVVGGMMSVVGASAAYLIAKSKALI
jgi:hypothetical protein